MGAVEGDLTQNRLPNVIQSLGRDRESGILQVSQNDVSKRIYFGSGSMVFARSTLHSDRLGEMLVRSGDLTRSHLALASNKMRARRAKLGRTLVSLGLLTERQMQARLADQIRGIICSLFTWQEGFYRFDSGIELIKPDVHLDLPTVPIILEGTRLMEPAAVREVLGDTGRFVSYTKDPRVIAHYANLTPEEGFVLSRVDGSSTLSDIVSISPLTEVETLRCLYGLLASGFLEVGKKSREVAPARARSQSPIESFHGSTTNARSRPATEPASSPADDEIQRDIEAKHASLAGGTYYDWLEVHRTADAKEIKKAFAVVVKKYHPDRHRAHVLQSCSGKLQTILAKMTQAYETLNDPQSRRRYDNSLRTEAPKGEVVEPVNPRPSAPLPPTPGEHVAERYYQEAKKYFAQRDYHEVVKLMEEAVAMVPTKGRYHCLLARALSRNPKWRKTAEEHFKKALAIEPFDTESLVGLAELYEVVGLPRRAQSLYAEAVEIDPGNAVLRMKLNALK